MTTKTEILYLDKYITNKIDEFRNHYTNQHRGRIITVALGLYFMQDQKKQDKYYTKASNFYKNSKQLDLYSTYGSVRKGKVRTSLEIKPEISKNLKGKNFKIVILASLMYIGLIK